MVVLQGRDLLVTYPILRKDLRFMFIKLQKFCIGLCVVRMAELCKAPELSKNHLRVFWSSNGGVDSNGDVGSNPTPDKSHFVSEEVVTLFCFLGYHYHCSVECIHRS